tara:strand:+ start:60 stop:440 length:381 start_codon:yes stop_codon:yes gene_type:complete
MGNLNSTINLYNFENVKTAIKENKIIINTLNKDNQNCLIEGTIDIESEVTLINKLIKENTDHQIIIYGKNNCDQSVLKKYRQLNKLGFKNVGVYPGGIFEWLLLQEVYGVENFPTNSLELDILKYK